MTTTKTNNTKVITGKVRLSYARLFEPYAMEEGQKEKYSVSLLIPKSDKKTIKAIKEAIEAAKENAKNEKFGGKIPANLRTPLRDGDEERPEKEEYQGHYFINASSVSRPQVVDRTMAPITEPDDLYSGCYARASINFYAYNVSGNRGIAAGLNNIQKWADGERLGGKSSAFEDFDELEEEMEDLLG
ncbi:DUF2815 family protein [Shouchella lonarensis]|uniref:Uncharacterized protein n=1 Tax=Shouchella lonarensis TaxID=1464122 RepID=A0A1G6HSJ4_9BACI|nr:DUF2815 family protein [Shouchella lonarensis]SDB96835.1 Protein of unknown function [Shouchella lonarensis]